MWIKYVGYRFSYIFILNVKQSVVNEKIYITDAGTLFGKTLVQVILRR